MQKLISWVVGLLGIGGKQHVIVTIIISAITAIFNSLPVGCLGYAIRLVKHAASSNELADNSARFDYVFTEMKRQYPDLAGNTLRIVIESALKSVQDGLV